MTARAIDCTAYDRIVDALRANGRTVVERGDGKAQAQCPAHDDHNPSLSIEPRRDGNGAVVYCHASCDVGAVLAAVGLTSGDLFDEPRLRAAYNPRRTYSYTDGRQVHRERGKKFYQKGNTKGTSLFGVEHITPGCTAFIPEGEKDVETVLALGAVAVCGAMGAGKAHKFDWSPLRGHPVVVVRDRDEPGSRHAADVVGLVSGIAASVRVVEAAVGKDLADHIAAGLTLDELVPVDLPYISPEPTANGQAVNSALPEPKLWHATDLKPAAQPRWLAKGRLPRDAVSLIIGEEGIGKSLLWVWLTALITTGREELGFGIPARGPGRVIIAAITEDDWSTTVRPRLEVAGAELSMIDVVCAEPDGSGAPVFPRDMQLLRDADPKPALIVVDAWLDTVPPSLRVKDPQDARLALHPWKELAATTGGAAVMLICHTNRVATANARDRYGATAELRKKARMSLYCQTDEAGRLVVGPEKANGVTTTAPASLFTIEAVPLFQPSAEHDGTVPRLVHLGESDQTAREHLANAYATAHDPGGGDDAMGWLAAYLAAGPRWADDVSRAAEAAGHSKGKLNGAKRRLHVQSKRDGAAAAWFWRLPQHQDTGKIPPPEPCVSTLISCDLAPHTQNQDIALSSEDSKKKIRDTRGKDRNLTLGGESRFVPRFVPPTGPGRCPECGFQVPTQGHREGCSANGGAAALSNALIDPEGEPTRDETAHAAPHIAAVAETAEPDWRADA